jgi:hypothetical protein
MGGPQFPRVIELPYRWAGREGVVRVEIAVNEDPAALGCPDFARGFPYCRASVEPQGRGGYADFLGWVQLATLDYPGGFVTDPFLPLGPAPYPFNFYGWGPTLFDAPHTDEDWNFIAHSFLCGLGGELHELRGEVRAVLGFSWGFLKRDDEIEFRDPHLLAAGDWDAHREYLARTYPEWTFAEGFFEDPLRP